MSGSAQRAKSFRPDIQGLRAVAVIAVILDHFLGWPSGGFVGVDVFFVISGFLITSLLLREQERTGTISFKGFYLRRAKRIMPAAILVILATCGAAFALFSNTRLTATVWDGFWATLFSANWRFAVMGTDYFQAGGPVSPLQHFWSLAVEEQFYFVWPWLMLLIFSAVGRRRIAAADNSRMVIGMVIIALTAGSFAWSVWETRENVSWAYFSTFSRAWELGVGAIVAVYASSLLSLGSTTRRVMAWVGLAGIVASVFVLSDAVAFPGPAAALPVLSSAILIAAGTGERQSSLWPLTNRVARYIGDISYSLYLWHFPVAILCLNLYAGDSVEYYVLGAVAMLALSIGSFHLVEDPIRKYKSVDRSRRRPKPKRFTGNRASLAGLAVLAAVTAATVTAALMATGPTGDVSVAAPIPGQSLTSTHVAKAKCWGAAALDASADCDRALGAEAAPNPKSLAEDTGNSYDCFPQAGKEMKSCTYGSGPTRVALVGDSHAASLLPGLSDQAEANGWTLDTYVGVGCIWERQSCAAMDAIEAKLMERAYDIVVTSAYRGSGNTNKAAQASSFAAAWQPVASTGAKVVVVEDVPMSTGPAVLCVQRVNFDVTDNECAIDLAMAYKADDAAVLASKLIPNAAAVDTSKYFCTDVSCPAVIGNVLVYRDDIAHISATYSKSLGPYLAKDIANAAARLDG